MSYLDRKDLLSADLMTRSITKEGSIKYYNTDKNVANIYIKLMATSSDGVQKEVAVDEASNYTVKIDVIKPKTNQIRTVPGVLNTDLPDETCAIWKFELGEDFTNQIGEAICQAYVKNATQNLTMKYFAYTVEADKLTGLNSEIVTDPDLPILKELIKEVQETAQTVNNIDNVNVSDTKTYSNKKIEEKFSGVDAQFNTVEKYITSYSLEDGVIKIPTDFATLPFTIQKKGNSYIHDFILDDNGYTDVFISKNGGTYSGLNENQPITLERFVTCINDGVYNNYSKLRLNILDEFYSHNLATISVNKDLIIVPKNVNNFSWIGKMADKTHSSYFTGEWIANENIFEITMVYNANILDVINRNELDVNGIPYLYKQTNSIIECKSTKGSWYKDSTNLKLYVNPHKTNTINYVTIIQDVNVVNFTCNSGKKIYFKNIGFVASAYGKIKGTDITSELYFIGCKHYRGKQDAFHVEGDYKCYSFDCVSAYGSKDCFNYYKGTDRNTLAVEINCIGYGAGKYKYTVSDSNTTTHSNNGSTAHDGMKVLRVGCKYTQCEGPIVADDSNCYSINIGVYCGTILKTNTGVNSCFYFYNNALTGYKQYVLSCECNNPSGYDIYGVSADTFVMDIKGRNKAYQVQYADLSDMFLV